MLLIPEYDYAFASQVVCWLLVEYYYYAFSDLPEITCYVRRVIKIILGIKKKKTPKLAIPS